MGKLDLEEVFTEEFLESVATTENEREQLAVYMEAFMIFQHREDKYHSLWKEYGVSDTTHHLKSKALRVYALAGEDITDDALDAINYAAFSIRNARAGRLG